MMKSSNNEMNRQKKKKKHFLKRTYRAVNAET